MSDNSFTAITDHINDTWIRPTNTLSTERPCLGPKKCRTIPETEEPQMAQNQGLDKQSKRLPENSIGSQLPMFLLMLASPLNIWHGDRLISGQINIWY